MIRFVSFVGAVTFVALAYLYKKGCKVKEKLEEKNYDGAETDLEKK